MTMLQRVLALRDKLKPQPIVPSSVSPPKLEETKKKKRGRPTKKITEYFKEEVEKIEKRKKEKEDKEKKGEEEEVEEEENVVENEEEEEVEENEVEEENEEKEDEKKEKTGTDSEGEIDEEEIDKYKNKKPSSKAKKTRQRKCITIIAVKELTKAKGYHITRDACSFLKGHFPRPKHTIDGYKALSLAMDNVDEDVKKCIHVRDIEIAIAIIKKQMKEEKEKQLENIERKK